MARQAVIQNGQSIWDVAIQEYGSVQGAFLLMEDNPGAVPNLGINLKPGTKLEVREEPEGIESKDLMNHFRRKEIKVNTTNERTSGGIGFMQIEFDFVVS